MELTKLRNIGAEMSRKLQAVGVQTAEQLREMGSKQAFFHLRAAYPEVCLVHLYTLQGAIDDLDYNKLPQSVKDDLKAFSDSLK